MKSKLILCFAVLSLSLLSSVSAKTVMGSGKIVTRYIKVAQFTSLEVRSSADVEIVKGNTLSVTLSDYENLLDVNTFSLSNGKLTISVKPNISINNSKAKIKIIIPGSLYSVKITGSGDVRLSQMSSLKEIEIVGSGDVYGSDVVNYKSLKISVAGSGDVKMKGKADKLSVIINGSGDVDLKDLIASEAECKINGSGDLRINAIKTLNISVTGSGDVVYYGNPQIIKHTSGSGDIIHH